MTFSTILEIIGRVVAIYVLVLVLMRLGGKRELAQLTPMDLLTMLLLSETVSPALTGNRASLGAGALAASTLVAISVVLGWITFRSRRFERLVEGEATVLIRDGEIDPKMMERHRITDQALRTALHQEGLSSPSEVRRGFVEPDGNISFIKAEH